MEQNIVLKQITTLSPQTIQSLEILQMETQELLDYIEEQAQENPTIEVDYKSNLLKEYNDIKKKLNWLESSDTQNVYYYKADKDEGFHNGVYDFSSSEEEDLCSYAKSQLNDIKPGSKLEKAVSFIIDNLNERGYLEEDNRVIARITGFSEDIVERAVKKVQSLEPAGIGARNLKECLNLQLKRYNCDNQLAYDIVDGYLEAVGKSHYRLISRELAADVKEVREICNYIKSLNPKPGIGFSANENPKYIIPDVIIKKTKDGFEVVSNDNYFPSIRISKYYRELLNNTDEKIVKEYLVNKIRKVKWVIKSIEQRKSTILRCAECILEMQEEFFKHGPANLVPMSFSDISHKLDVHESTVSRSLRNKYLQCNFGIFPMKFFFSRAVGNENDVTKHSPEAIKSVIEKIINDEDKRKPISDNKLSEMLMKKRIDISRRTITKYREELGIANSVERKALD